MRNWFINLFLNQKENNVLSVGSHVSTPKGRGVITGGNLIILLDNPLGIVGHPNQRQWTFNIDKDVIKHA